MPEKNKNLFLIMNLILVTLDIVGLVLYFFLRDSRLILGVVILTLLVITLLIGNIIWKRKQLRWKVPKGMARYYLLMGGILVSQVVIGYLFYLLAVHMPVLFAVISLVFLLGLVFVLIYNNYKEKIKIVEKDKVLSSYRTVAVKAVMITGLAFGGAIIIKAVTLLFRAI